MAPAPGPGHPENDDDIQAPAPTPTPTPAMTSSQDRHENGASPTPMYWNSYPTYPSSLLSSYPTPTATYTITAYLNGMNAVVVVDAAGKTWQAYTSAYSVDGGSHSNTYSSPSPLAELSPTIPFIATGPVTSSAAATSSWSSRPGSEFQEKPEHHGPPFPAVIAMSIIVPVIVIVLSLCAFYFLCIRRKRQVHQDQEVPAMVAARRVPEMKDTGVGGGPVMMDTRVVAPVSMSPLTSPATTSSAGTATPPVILSTTMNDAYYTGIDTSDHVSLTDQRSEASADTFGEEPPPPYRPRSVPPISRETSVRNSMCRNTSVRSSRHDPMSGSNLMRRSIDVRSPFDDPPEDSDDDTLSQISTIRSLSRRDMDRLSVVSDMSYQEELTHTHPSA
ncbi:hypothetical protein EG327_001093 [Venturia inaequalis]|uniref:Uncharacterized protein n=2 Tax=Venturia inaequalis TaxID=5025 RepID=A0A8H3VLK1_VENIN|nr:hypothetical protein EG327_001093 [Venturia inaequalis]